LRVVEIHEMRDIEAQSINHFGLDKSLMVENVGREGADFLEQKFLRDQTFPANEILFLIGQGNNGAEGLAIARHLWVRNHRVHCFLLFPQDACGPELQKQLHIARQFKVKISEISSPDQVADYFTQTQNSFFVVDAILGTGLRLPLSNYLFEIINMVNTYASMVVAIDISSGVDADNGVISSVGIKADYSLALGFPKAGQFNYQGARHAGEIHVLNIGHPQHFHEQGDKFLLDMDTVARYLPPRDKFGHKNTFGHVLVLGGSTGMTGAVLLAANAALKAGAGLVTVATWAENYMELVSRANPEIITGVIPLSKTRAHSVLKTLNEYDAIVLGPGFGHSPLVRDVVVEVVNHFYGPVVLDADAINMLNLEQDLALFQMRKGLTIFTPHFGEFARMVKTEVDEVSRAPLRHTRQFVDMVNGVMVLKGPVSYIGFPNGKIHIQFSPNDGLATAGSGDVLAGILGGFLGQIIRDKKQSRMFVENERSFGAINLGVYLHSLAGQIAAQKEGTRSMTAGSLLRSFPEAFEKIEKAAAPYFDRRQDFVIEEHYHSQEQL
jgi:ADP-dependent NAD(P)H-hydrate dehydratase / NAD(P)H-hydrate epimerase